MLLDKFQIPMTPITCLVDIGNMGHGFGILTWQDIVFSVTIIAISCPLRSFHDHFRMKSLFILFLCFIVATLAIHPPVGSFLSTLGVGIIRYFCMAVGAGELSMNRSFEARFRYKKGNCFPEGIPLR